MNHLRLPPLLMFRLSKSVASRLKAARQSLTQPHGTHFRSKGNLPITRRVECWVRLAPFLFSKSRKLAYTDSIAIFLIENRKAGGHISAKTSRTCAPVIADSWTRLSRSLTEYMRPNISFETVSGLIRCITSLVGPLLLSPSSDSVILNWAKQD